MLKSIWLEGKRNRHVDHLIHTLVTQYLPHMEIRHKRQERGMEGANLAETRRRQILMRAPETPVEKIRKNDDLHFDVQSSNSNIIYQVNLGTTTCSCSDFPRVRLCKHIAAVLHFFGGADPGPQPPVNAGASSSPVQRDGSTAHMDDSSWPKFTTNHVINTWQNEPHVSAASKAHFPRTRLSHVHIVVLFLCNINYHELYKFLFYKISKLHLWYE